MLVDKHLLLDLNASHARGRQFESARSHPFITDWFSRPFPSPSKHYFRYFSGIFALGKCGISLHRVAFYGILLGVSCKKVASKLQICKRKTNTKHHNNNG